MKIMEQAITNLLTNILQSVIVILGALIAVATNKVINYLETKTKSIKETNTKQLANQALNDLNEIIKKNVGAAQATLVQVAKEANEDGKLTKEDGDKIKEAVCIKIKSQLSDLNRQYIAKEIKNLDNYINSMVEYYLAQLKNQI